MLTQSRHLVRAVMSYCKLFVKPAGVLLNGGLVHWHCWHCRLPTPLHILRCLPAHCRMWTKSLSSYKNFYCTEKQKNSQRSIISLKPASRDVCLHIFKRKCRAITRICSKLHSEFWAAYLGGDIVMYSFIWICWTKIWKHNN